MDVSETLDQISQDYMHAFEDLSEEDFNWSGSAGEWSIAQNVAHVIKINETYFPIWEDLLAGNYRPPFMARFKAYAKMIGGLIYSSVLPDRRKRSKTMKLWEPGSGPFALRLLKDFLQHQEKVKAYMKQLQDEANHGCVIHSPSSKYVVYPLQRAFDIIIAHEKRHLEQAKGVLVQLRG